MIFALIVLSFVLYFLLFGRGESVLVKPTLQKMVFYREYLLLTMIPYVYYLHNERYESHPVLSQLRSDVFFYYAAIFAFIFLFFFLLTYKFLQPAISNSLSGFNLRLRYNRLLYLLRLFSMALFVYLIIVTIKYDASVLGLMKYSVFELEKYRSIFSKGGGFLTFNKIVIKSWVPMLSYLYFYLYFSGKHIFNGSDRFFMWLSFSSGVLASLWFFEKSVIVFYLVGIIGVYVYSGGLLKKKYTFLAPFVFVFLVAVMYVLTYQDVIVDGQYLVDILLHRTFSQSVGSVMAIDYFMQHDFFYFSGVSNFLASVSGDVFQSPYGAIIDYYVPETSETSGAMSSFVTGEAFGLFGLYGVLASGVIVGLYYSFFEATKASDFLAVIFVGVYALYFSHFYVSSSFYSFLWPVGVVYKVIPFFLIAFFSSSAVKR